MADELRARIRATVDGMEEIGKLKNAIRQIKGVVKPASADIDQLRKATTLLGNVSDRTENELRSQISVLTDLRANVSLTGKRYKQLTRDINKAEAALAKSGTSGKGASGRFGRTAKTLGAVAGAGVFGGPEGAAGAAIGGIIGGPGGALAGGAIGAQVKQVRVAISSTAEYSAALGLQRKALRLVIADTIKYNKAQDFLQKTSRKLAIPQDIIVRQFTALTASVKGAGKSVSDAEKVFLSIASGIRGTGGSLEDMKSAMTAVSQVFSKGKVSAEELRQQLGERLAGAFTIFAESMDIRPDELDKALEQGKVTLDDFMKFSDTLFKKYGKNAEILAKGPEAAGDRLATAMSEMKDELGKMLRPMGAEFQTFAADAVEEINKVITAMNKLFGIGDENKLANLKKQLNFWQSILTEQEKVDTALKKIPFLNRGLEGTAGFEGTKGFVQALTNKIAALEKKIKDTDTATSLAANTAKTKLTEMQKAWGGVRSGVEEYVKGLGDVAKEMKEAVGNALQGLEDTLVNFVTTGKLAFKDLARSILADMARIVIRQQILKPILGAIFPSAKGNVFASNKIVPFAKGGIIDRPTIFPLKNGAALAGEAGEEAILPLRRGKGGRLGVESSGGGGGGGTSVVVNVDASGSDVQGDEDAGRQLGQLIAIAVQGQLIEQSRPGGLLNQS